MRKYFVNYRGTSPVGPDFQKPIRSLQRIQQKKTQRGGRDLTKGTQLSAPDLNKWTKKICYFSGRSRGHCPQTSEILPETWIHRVFLDLPRDNKYLEGKGNHTSIHSGALVPEGLNQDTKAGAGGGVWVQMSALPTPRSGYSEHNHYEDSQAWHCQQAAFHQGPGQAIPTARTPRSWGASYK